jgi:hypothetical protein
MIAAGQHGDLEERMSSPLNLTLKRGPSVWDEPSRSPANWRACGVAAGAALATLALHPRANRRWLIGAGLGVVATFLLAGRFISTVQAGRRKLDVVRTVRNDHLVDAASEDSFPASDPVQYL